MFYRHLCLVNRQKKTPISGGPFFANQPRLRGDDAGQASRVADCHAIEERHRNHLLAFLAVIPFADLNRETRVLVGSGSDVAVPVGGCGRETGCDEDGLWGDGDTLLVGLGSREVAVLANREAVDTRQEVLSQRSIGTRSILGLDSVVLSEGGIEGRLHDERAASLWVVRVCEDLRERCNAVCVEGSGGAVVTNRGEVGGSGEREHIVHDCLHGGVGSRGEECALQHVVATFGDFTVVEAHHEAFVLVERDGLGGRGHVRLRVAVRTDVGSGDGRRDTSRDSLALLGDITTEVGSEGVDEREFRQEGCETILCNDCEVNTSECI